MNDLLHFLSNEDKAHYIDPVEIPGFGICALMRMVFTVGIVYDINTWGIGGRYCYHSYAEAKEALHTWKGNCDAPGNWIKRKDKAFGEINNPNYQYD